MENIFLKGNLNYHIREPIVVESSQFGEVNFQICQNFFEGKQVMKIFYLNALLIYLLIICSTHLLNFTL